MLQALSSAGPHCCCSLLLSCREANRRPTPICSLLLSCREASRRPTPICSLLLSCREASRQRTPTPHSLSCPRSCCWCCCATASPADPHCSACGSCCCSGWPSRCARAEPHTFARVCALEQHNTCLEIGCRAKQAYSVQNGPWHTSDMEGCDSSASGSYKHDTS